MLISCVSTVSYEILLNGSSCGSVTPGRGLRQGDPLSPYLFILCFEVLSRLFSKEEQTGHLDGIYISQNGIAISYLMYADDLVIACKANATNGHSMKRSFDRYCSWLGQRVNLYKFSILFSASMPRNDMKEVKRILKFKNVGENSVYLGNPFSMGRRKADVFGRLKERVQQRLEGWQSKLLSKAGKATLIKSVIQSIPVYKITTFHRPNKVCKEMDSVTCHFW